MGLIASDKRILVVGLGKTGLSCVRFLSAQGHTFAVADSREQPPGLARLQADYPDVVCRCGAFDVDFFKSFNELIVSPGISIQSPAIVAAAENGAVIRGDIDVFAAAASAPIVAITGSNGKSTVTTLVGEMAKAAGVRVAVGGNLGTPALDLLDDQVQLYVVELSSFQLETTHQLNAAAATVLNVSNDHMDRYDTMLNYFQAKQRIFQGCRHAVVNLDDPLSQPLLREGMTYRCFGLDRVNPGDYGTRQDQGRVWLTRGLEDLMPADALALRGRHNVANVLAALALGEAVGLPMTAMLAAAKAFKGLSHRCQLIRTLGGVDYINDSKGTNVGATVAALESLSLPAGRILLIAGGDGKGADFRPLRAPVQQHCRAVLLIGRDAPLIQPLLEALLPVERCHSMAQAVVKASLLAEPGDTVLLSPACSSLDMFENYEARGASFIAATEAL